MCLAMTITVNTATLKQKLSHYLGLASQGRDVLITSHKRIVARLLGEDGDSRLPLREPTKPASAVVAPGVVLQPAMRYPLRVKVSPGSWSMSFQSSASVVDVAEDPAWFAW